MKLDFFDGDMNLLKTVAVEAADHWEACEIGFQMMVDGAVPGAEDFKVYEKYQVF